MIHLSIVFNGGVGVLAGTDFNELSLSKFPCIFQIKNTSVSKVKTMPMDKATLSPTGYFIWRDEYFDFLCIYF